MRCVYGICVKIEEGNFLTTEDTEGTESTEFFVSNSVLSVPSVSPMLPLFPSFPIPSVVKIRHHRFICVGV